MLRTRKDVSEYAYSLCRTMLEQSASKYEKGEVPTVIDNMGYVPTLLEEIFRPFWGMAPVIAEKEDIMLNINGREVPLAGWISDFMYEGLSADSEKSWERYRNSGAGWGLDFQNLTEIAGLLIGLYFCREKTWDRFPPERRQMFADRIYSFCKSECEHTAENNHIWFPMFCVLVLKKLGHAYPDTDRYLKEGLEALEKMYLSEGWYSDGPFGRFDYYVVWSMHSYPLLWCLIEDESFPGYELYRSRFTERAEKFISQYIYCFDSDGAFPPFGRSLSYKFAAVCIFPLAALAGCRINQGLARRAMLKNLSYFEENMHLTGSGILPAGFLYHTPGIVENYTGDGGAYWCTKTFLCLLMKEDHPFWTAEDEALPSETGSYLVRPLDPGINLTVSGTKECGITIYNNIFQYYQHGIYCNPFNDMAGYYCKFAYNSKAGFAISTRDRTASDSMISLQTPDESMTSHRWGFTDKGSCGNILLSSHVPFSNDTATHIETAVLPLDDGCHVRLHRVVLSQNYRVIEGGFPIGLWNDYHIKTGSENSLTIENGRLRSSVSAVSDVPLKFTEKNPTPGLHVLAPHAAYPAYTTEILPAGEYWFASAYRISSEDGHSLPVLKLLPDRLLIRQGSDETGIPFSLLTKGQDI